MARTIDCSARGGAGVRSLVSALAVALICSATVATAQEADDEEVNAADRAELAREFTDPLTRLPQVFLQDIYTPANYGTEAQTNRLIARAIIPRIPRLSLLPAVQLVRPTLQLVTVPTGKGSDTRTEFGDIQLFDFAVMPWPDHGTGFYWAVGPVFSFPTATHKLAGQGSWQAGPGFASLYKGIPGLLFGILVQNPISFAYTSPDRRPVNTLLVQPIIAAYLGKGFYIKSADSSWSMGWHQHSPTVIPVSLGIGHIMLREGLPPLNFFVTGEWTAYRQFAAVAPQTSVRFGITMAFPEYRPW